MFFNCTSIRLINERGDSSFLLRVIYKGDAENRVKKDQPDKGEKREEKRGT